MRARLARLVDQARDSGFLAGRQTILTLAACFAVAIAGVLWQDQQILDKMARSNALQAAVTEAATINEFRTLYTSEVVSRISVSGDDIQITHDYAGKEGAIPLPATLTILLGERLVRKSGRGGTRLYSPYPFPWREETGGLRDEFERAAWNRLVANPDRPFSRIEETPTGPILRYALADRLRQSCVPCHNNHPATPKNDWAVGDVRGVLEVRVPVIAAGPGGNLLSPSTLVLLVLLGVVATLSLWVVTSRLRRDAMLLERRVKNRNAELRDTVHALETQQMALDRSAIVSVTDDRGIITHVNDAFCDATGYSRAELIGQNHRILKSGEHPRQFYEEMWRTITKGRIWRGEVKNKRKDGTFRWMQATLVPDMDATGRLRQYIGIRADITARKLAEQQMILVTEELRGAHRAAEATNRKLEKELDERKMLESQLAEAQKLEAVGQLAAGVAHEINTPAQYVGDNMRFLDENFQEIVPLLVKADELAEAIRTGAESMELADALKDTFEKADIKYLNEEIPRAIKQSLEGNDRVRKIVQSMKNFSHPGPDEMANIDLNAAIESTIIVATNEWKYVAEMETALDPDLPAVPCVPGEINQVILNLIVNAAHAIADVTGDDGGNKGTITVGTRRDGAFAEIRITDTGTGIPEEARGRVFDPFFTTKGVGEGTGQGLSIAHRIIVKKHAGTLAFETETGNGTTFIIRLPLK